MEQNKRLIWVDNVKVIACILVVLGHFFQSMRDIIPNNDISEWFIQTVYYFHVPLFFICSGYLYQKLSKVEDIKSWANNIAKKALALGVPYFTFSFATWMLKTIFSGSVRTEMSRGLLDTLFIHPTSPYWYLYALFFIFLVTPTFKNEKIAIIGPLLSISIKIAGVVVGGGIPAISYILSNEIWFVIGMCISSYNLNGNKIKSLFPLIAAIIFVSLSIATYVLDISNWFLNFLLGLIACFSVITGMQILYRDNQQSKLFGILAKYTMTIYLMHTLFAAPFRIVLLKLGVTNPFIHIPFGIAVTFIGPMVAAIIMEKSKYLEFFLYPNKVIKQIRQNHN